MAVFLVGLRDDSRIKQKITGVKATLQEQLLGIIADRLGVLANAYGSNISFSVYDRLMGYEEPETSGHYEGQVFASIEDFNKARYGG